MPKMKTKRSVKKRFKISGTGKLSRRRAAMSHYLGKKNSKKIRHNRQATEVDSTNEKQVLRLLGR